MVGYIQRCNASISNFSHILPKNYEILTTVEEEEQYEESFCIEEKFIDKLYYIQHPKEDVIADEYINRLIMRMFDEQNPTKPFYVEVRTKRHFLACPCCINNGFVFFTKNCPLFMKIVINNDEKMSEDIKSKICQTLYEDGDISCENSTSSLTDKCSHVIVSENQNNYDNFWLEYDKMLNETKQELKDIILNRLKRMYKMRNKQWIDLYGPTIPKLKTQPRMPRLQTVMKNKLRKYALYLRLSNSLKFGTHPLEMK